LCKSDSDEIGGGRVYDWVNKKPIVARPEKCLAGCTMCMNMCSRDAISLPPIAEMKKKLKVEKLYVRIKDILREQGKIPQDG
jgi:ferredoxin